MLMDDKYITIKEVTLKNNCPECFNNEGLHLTFRQKFVENKFYKSITSNVKYDILCKMCETNIYPVQWTDDIERVVEYQNRAFVPKKASTNFKNIFWVIIGLLVLSIIGIALYISGVLF